ALRQERPAHDRGDAPVDGLPCLDVRPLQVSLKAASKVSHEVVLDAWFALPEVFEIPVQRLGRFVNFPWIADPVSSKQLQLAQASERVPKRSSVKDHPVPDPEADEVGLGRLGTITKDGQGSGFYGFI